jgi:hypothetical protein
MKRRVLLVSISTSVALAILAYFYSAGVVDPRSFGIAGLGILIVAAGFELSVEARFPLLLHQFLVQCSRLRFSNGSFSLQAIEKKHKFWVVSRVLLEVGKLAFCTHREQFLIMATATN